MLRPYAWGGAFYFGGVALAFDFKKTPLYRAETRPQLVTVPPAPYLAVEGQGDPNEPEGAYQRAISALYAVAYTLRMSYKTDHQIAGYYPYVVPPLEGFWRQRGAETVDLSRKEDFRWISVLRLPEFVTAEDAAWAVETASRKKKIDCSAVEFRTVEEGLCVQMLHRGPFDREAETVAEMDAFLEREGYVNDLTETRLHHEIYLSDARKAAPEDWKTIVRHPVKKRG